AWVEAPQGASMAEWSDMDVLSDSALAADPPLPASGKNGNGACSSSGEEEMKSVGDSSSSSSSAGEEKEREGGAAAAAADDEPPLVLGQRRRHTSRAAAMAASKSLGVIMQAVNTFEADMRRERLYKYRSKSHGGRRALALALGGGGGGTDKDGDSVRIMFTSVRATEQQQRQIASMGGEIVSDAAHATHLVCVEIKRTLKMLMALASGRVSIVSLAWLEHSLAQRRWVSMRAGDADPLAAKCRVVDAAAERRWSFRLEESVQRASRRRLLEGVTVFVTPQSEPPLTVLRPLIEIAGGEAVDSLPEARLRALVSASVAASGTSGGGSSGSPPLLVVSCREDSHMWPMFRPAGNQRMPIHATEMLLTGLLRQQIQRSDDEYALNP
ncbi:Mediator of DNA damage checkpoint protein 1, partial [Coemansia sp. RSA 2681]